MKLTALDVEVTSIRRLVVVGSCAWWLLLAALSRMELSLLQLVWSQTATLFIFLFAPLCIAVGLLGVHQPVRRLQPAARREFLITYILFYILMATFALQCVLFVPPALSGEPNSARLEWGFKYVHVLTEITIRTTVLLCIGTAATRGKFTFLDRVILLSSLVYTVLVVSRSFMLEIIFYWALGSYFIARTGPQRSRWSMKHLLIVLSVLPVFILYGNWRQGSDFSIVDYGEVLVDSNALAWVFGYFLVNYDNLALLIMENFTNQAASNVFGPMLQTLQIEKFTAVDDYLYVGKFNLGTGIRSFVLDFGPWAGGAIFALMWTAVMALPGLCRSTNARFAATALVAYMGFCLPITGRIEEPVYLFPLIWIIIADSFTLLPMFAGSPLRQPPSQPPPSAVVDA
jgi:hypothetical protein